MMVEILYFDGCSTYTVAERILREVLVKQGMEAEIELILVNTDEEAMRLRFPGSPTIRIGGHDLFPAPGREDWRLGCRVYATPEGLRGSPTADMFEQALTALGESDTRSRL